MITEAIIEQTLQELFDNLSFTKEPSGLYDPLRYMIGIGGKRVRPRLCLLAYSLYKNSFSEEVLSPAAALEVFHSFTLIHDDIMDNADVRRGVPTVYRKWDGNTAILSGDVMCIDSYRRLAKAPKAVLGDVLELFNKTAAEVCEGQQYDMDFERLNDVTMADYVKMTGLKTAVLIACAAKMGALIAGAPKHHCEQLYKFGYDLGLAFQVADDYLDTFGDVKVFGKAIGGDILNGKKTWLLIRALEKGEALEEAGIIGPGKGKATICEALAKPAGTEAQKAEKIALMKGIYEAFGVDEDAKYEVIKLHDRALSHLNGLGLSKVKLEMLHRFAGRLVGRNK